MNSTMVAALIVGLLCVGGGAAFVLADTETGQQLLDSHPSEVTVTLLTDGHGTVAGSGVYTYGATAALTATADDGYVFLKWSDGSTAPAREYSATKDLTVEAIFAKLCTVNANANLNGAGAIAGGGTVAEGSTVTLTATANSGYTFLRWTEGGQTVATAPSFTMTANGDRTLTAVFAHLYTVTAAINESRAGTVGGTATVVEGSTVTLTAGTANHGFYFKQWLENGRTFSTSQSIGVPATGNRTLTADYERLSYNVSIRPNYQNAIQSSGGFGSHVFESTAALYVTPMAGYSFTGWYDAAGHQLSASARYSFAVQDTTALEARFAIIHDASFTVRQSASLVPLTMTSTSVYNVDIAQRSWTVTNAITHQQEHYTLSSGQNSPLLSISYASGEAVTITQTVTYSDGQRATSSQTAVANQQYTHTDKWMYMTDEWTNLFGTVNNHEAQSTYTVDLATYYHYYSMSHVRDSFDHFVTKNDPLVQQIAKSLLDLCNGRTDHEKILTAMRFVQHYPYKLDTESKYASSDYWDYPYQLMFDGEGDCEDHAFLFAAIAEDMGYDAAVMDGDVRNSDGQGGGHCFPLVSFPGLSGAQFQINNKLYTICEVTDDGATQLFSSCKIGEVWWSNITVWDMEDV